MSEVERIGLWPEAATARQGPDGFRPWLERYLVTGGEPHGADQRGGDQSGLY